MKIRDIDAERDTHFTDQVYRIFKTLFGDKFVELTKGVDPDWIYADVVANLDRESRADSGPFVYFKDKRTGGNIILFTDNYVISLEQWELYKDADATDWVLGDW
jgi:hypothetical protein